MAHLQMAIYLQSSLAPARLQTLAPNAVASGSSDGRCIYLLDQRHAFVEALQSFDRKSTCTFGALFINCIQPYQLFTTKYPDI